MTRSIKPVRDDVAVAGSNLSATWRPSDPSPPAFVGGPGVLDALLCKVTSNQDRTAQMARSAAKMALYAVAQSR